MFHKNTKKNVIVLMGSAAVILSIIFWICLYYILTPVLEISYYEPIITVSGLADTFESFMYNGNYYVYSGLLTYENGGVVTEERLQEILDRELGVTVSEEVEAATERNAVHIDLRDYPDFTCRWEGLKIYALKGYDPSFRLVGIDESGDGRKQVRIYESPNSLKIRRGKDFFSKLNIGEILSANYSTYQDENFKPIDRTKLELIKVFVRDLDSAKPYKFVCRDYASTYHVQKYKMIHLGTDGVMDTGFALWKDGDNCFVSYVTLGSFEIVFTAEKDSFNRLWEIME